ncbi:MAG: hypothetical protein ACWGQW_24825 [bacterium]
MNKQLEDLTYTELVDHVTREVHSALLSGGGKGMHEALSLWLSQAVYWHTLQEAKRLRGGKNNAG